MNSSGFRGFESHPLRHICEYGELAELAEGARLLSEYMGINLYRGFESLTLRQLYLVEKDARWDNQWASAYMFAL